MIHIIRATRTYIKRFILLNKTNGLFIVVLILGAVLRLYGLNWDQGQHLHPDERAIVMFTTPLQLPKSISEFLSPESPWNPHFFAYGNFPLYLLKATAALLANFDPLYLSYEKINLVGRVISAIADIGTVVLIFLLAKKLFNRTTGTLASFFYAVSVFPIQAAHFYAIDTLLTFFIILTLYQLVRFYEKPSIPNSILVGIFFGLSLATKISAIPLVIAIALAIAVDFILLVIKQPHKPHIWFPHLPRFLKRLFSDGIAITISTVIIFIILQPYAIIDFQEFWRQSMQQRQMTYDAFTFPYTLQYVGKAPYWHELKNIFLWGQGPILATISFLGALYISFRIIRKHLGWWRSDDFDSSEVDVHLRGAHHRFAKASPGESATSKVSKQGAKTMNQWNNRTIIIMIFFWVYFLIVGKFAVGWMRYMLPLYPLLCLFAGLFAWQLLEFIQNKLIQHKFLIFNFKFLIFLALLAWPLSFMHIYTKPNTRVLASQWIYENIPPNKIIAREHWDDGMPIGGNISYKILELPIYEMQNPVREAEIYQILQQSDYIIIASNRLYTPLQRISRNCQKWNLPQERCPHNAARYYKRLFNGDLGFQKVVEFAVYPSFSFFIFNFSFDDSSADESFTVYDHPKVVIFKRTL